jgi:hypothetical protein
MSLVREPSRFAAGETSAQLRRLMRDEDRELLSVLGSGVSAAAIAGVLGCNVGTLLRRIGRLRRMLSDPRAAVVARECGRLGPIPCEIAIRIFIWGQGARAIAEELNVGLRPALRVVEYVQWWVEEQVKEEDGK